MKTTDTHLNGSIYLELSKKYGENFKPYAVASCVVYDEHNSYETYIGQLTTIGKGIVIFFGFKMEPLLVDTYNDGTLRFLSITKDSFEWQGRSIDPKKSPAPTKSTEDAEMILCFDRDRDTYNYVAIGRVQAEKINTFLLKWLN